MKKKLNLKFLIFLISTIIVIIYLFINFMVIGDDFDDLKRLLSNDQKLLIKKYIFPHKHPSYQSKKEIKFIQEGKDLEIIKSSVELSNSKILKKYKLTPGLYAGISNTKPGSAYIDFFENNLFVLSSRGVLAFKKNLDNDEINFKQIKNNIDDFIGIKQFGKSNKYSLKDLISSEIHNRVYQEEETVVIRLETISTHKTEIRKINNGENSWKPHNHGQTELTDCLVSRPEWGYNQNKVDEVCSESSVMRGESVLLRSRKDTS